MCSCFVTKIANTTNHKHKIEPIMIHFRHFFEWASMFHLAFPGVWLKAFAIKGENLKRPHTVKGRFCHHLLAFMLFQPVWISFICFFSTQFFFFFSVGNETVDSTERLHLNSDGNNVSHLQLLDHKERVMSDVQLAKMTIKMTITSLLFPH